MRTTLILDDEIVRQAKKLAAEQDATLGEIVNRALRAALAANAQEAPSFSMLTFGERAPTTHHEPSDLALLLEEDEPRGAARARGTSTRRPSARRRRKP